MTATLRSQETFDYRPRRIVPPWVVFALGIASFGTYVYLWFFLTWRQMRQELGTSALHPVLHGLGLFLPLVGVFRVYRHFTGLRGLALRRAVKPRLAPEVALLIWLLAPMPIDTFLTIDSVTAFLRNGTWWEWSIPGFLQFAGLAVVSGMVAVGQYDLNRTWRTGDRPAERHLPVAELLVIALGACLIAWLVYNYYAFPGPPMTPAPPSVPGRPL